MTVTVLRAAPVIGHWAAGDRLLDWAERSGHRQVTEPHRADGGLIQPSCIRRRRACLLLRVRAVLAP